MNERESTMLRGLLVAIVLIAAAMLLTTCGGGHKRAIVQGFSPGSSALNKTSPEGLPAEAGLDYRENASLDSALAELDALETPEGVDKALFEELKDELGEALHEQWGASTSRSGVSFEFVGSPGLETDSPRGMGKLTSTPPTGEFNKVTDLAITDNGGGTYTLTWHYRNLGDYDQNGTVGISDITPIAMHYNETYDIEDENCLLAVIDGSGNYVVDIADITPIAMNYGVELDAYIVVGDDTWQGPFGVVNTVRFSEATGIGRKQFACLLDPPEYEYYLVVPRDSLGEPGEPSSIVAIHGSEGPSIVSVSPTLGLVGSEVTFTAEVSGDAPFIYQWDFGGGATPNTSTEQSPTVMLGDAGTYDASVSASNAFGEDTFDFALVVSDVEPPAILAVSPIEGESGTEVTFSCAVSGDPPFAYSWDFNGGSEPDASEDSTPNVILGTAGIYQASLTVANIAGENVYPFTLTVGASSAPPEVLTVAPLSGLSGTTPQFTAVVTGARPLAYDWDFGGGGNPNKSSEASPIVTLGDFGEYDASLTVTNAHGEAVYPFVLTVPIHYEDWVHSWRLSGTEGASASSIVLDNFGDIYIAGTIWNTANWSSLIIKYDADGNLKWAKSWSPPGSDYSVSTATVTDTYGYVYVAVYTADINQAGSADIALLKYDADGNVIWEKSYSSGANDISSDMAFDVDGYLYITGKTESYGPGSENLLLLKLDLDGDIIWQQTWGGTNLAYGNGITVDGNGNVYVTGSSNSFGDGDTDILLLKYSPTGSLLWQKLWDGDQDTCIGYGLALDNIGNVHVTGMTRYSGLPANCEVSLLKFSSAGSLLWQKAISVAEGAAASSLIVDGSSYIYTGGNCYTSGYGGDALLMKFDSAGNALWQRTWGGSSYESVYALALDGNGVLHICGNAPNAYGVWQDISATVRDPSGSVSSPAGTVSASGFVQDVIEGTIMELDGVIDVGGGNSDALVMKLNPSYQ